MQPGRDLPWLSPIIVVLLCECIRSNQGQVIHRNLVLPRVEPPRNANRKGALTGAQYVQFIDNRYRRIIRFQWELQEGHWSRPFSRLQRFTGHPLTPNRLAIPRALIREYMQMPDARNMTLELSIGLCPESRAVTLNATVLTNRVAVHMLCQAAP